jgi:hypothetical protein
LIFVILGAIILVLLLFRGIPEEEAEKRSHNNVIEAACEYNEVCRQVFNRSCHCITYCTLKALFTSVCIVTLTLSNMLACLCACLLPTFECRAQGLDGLCCPSSLGTYMSCCATSAASCASNPGCAILNLMGNCCPTDSGDMLGCC